MMVMPYYIDSNQVVVEMPQNQVVTTGKVEISKVGLLCAPHPTLEPQQPFSSSHCNLLATRSISVDDKELAHTDS